MIAALTLSLITAARRHWLVPAAIFLHLILDTLTGGIMWLRPVSNHLFTAVAVPATHNHWVRSFIAHWTFAAELAICAAIAYHLCRNILGGEWAKGPEGARARPCGANIPHPTLA